MRIILTALLALMMLGANAQNKDKKKPVKIKKNVEYTTESGLKYKIIEQGNGEPAVAGSNVTVHYTGTLPNGTKFDSSKDRNQPFTFKLGAGRVIRGWDEGIALLRVGDKAILTIPPTLGYGDMSNGAIPANSTLIFEVELIDVKVPAKPWDIKSKDTVTLASGLKYIVVSKSTNPDAAKAEAGKNVSVHYTGFLEGGNIFDSSVDRGEPITFQLGVGRVIKGWDEGIAQMKVGDKLRLIIPSTLGYGERGAGGVIPPNATLYFDVELVNVQ